MRTYYYIDANGETCGPVGVDDLRRMMKAGEIEPDALVAEPGSVEWRPVAGIVLAVASGDRNTESPPLGQPPVIFPIPAAKAKGLSVGERLVIIGGAVTLLVIVILIAGAPDSAFRHHPTEMDREAYSAVLEYRDRELKGFMFSPINDCKFSHFGHLHTVIGKLSMEVLPGVISNTLVKTYLADDAKDGHWVLFNMTLVK